MLRLWAGFHDVGMKSGNQGVALAPDCRQQHIVDLENLSGGWVTPARTVEIFRRYQELVPIGPLDDVVVGLSPATAPAAAFDVHPRSRVRVGSPGPDSADDALIAAIDPDFTAAHFPRVIIASGDHAFAALAASLRARGVEVVVLFVPLHVAAVLYTAASDSRRFPAMAAA